jgi:hypothetical protein
MQNVSWVSFQVKGGSWPGLSIDAAGAMIKDYFFLPAGRSGSFASQHRAETKSAATLAAVSWLHPLAWSFSTRAMNVA